MAGFWMPTGGLLRAGVVWEKPRAHQGCLGAVLWLLGYVGFAWVYMVGLVCGDCWVLLLAVGYVVLFHGRICWAFSGLLVLLVF